MKKIIAFLSLFFIMFTFASCKETAEKQKAVETTKFSQTETTNQPQTEATTTPEPMSNSINFSEWQDESFQIDVKQLYQDFIGRHSSRYSEHFSYDSEESVVNEDPIFTYIDLDADDTLELIYFKQFTDHNVAYVYFFDIYKGEVFEITGSDYVGRYRTSDQFKVIEYNEKYYVTRTNNDGMWTHRSTVYSYDGQSFVPKYTISGQYNEPSYYYVSDKGHDIFETLDFFDTFDENEIFYNVVSEDEFTEIEEKLRNFGTVVFSSSENFVDYNF